MAMRTGSQRAARHREELWGRLRQVGIKAPQIARTEPTWIASLSQGQTPCAMRSTHAGFEARCRTEQLFLIQPRARRSPQLPRQPLGTTVPAAVRVGGGTRMAVMAG